MRYALLHAYSCPHPRTHSADASAAWRPSPHTAVEPRPYPGAPAGTAAGPAGRAVAPPYAAAAALSNAPAIEAASRRHTSRLQRLRSFLHSPFRQQIRQGSDLHGGEGAQCMKTGVHVGPCSGRHGKDVAGRPPRPTTPPHGAMQRGRRRRGKSGGPPRPREQIRLPQEPVSAGKLPRQIRLGCIEPFPSRPDKTLPGTLHHSGNRPAPPSDHIPLARRSAFQRGPAREFGRACGVRTQREDFMTCRRAAICQQMEKGTLGFRFRCWSCVALRIDRELTHATRRPTS
jgi:hypothetical protein